MFQICLQSPSVAFLSSSSECYTWLSSHVLFIQKHLLPPFLSSCSVSHSLALTLLPSCPLSPFLTSALLSLSHHFSGSFRDACHFSCCFLTPAQDMKWLFCVYGRMGTEREREERWRERRISVWSLWELEADIRLWCAHCKFTVCVREEER